MTMNIRAAFSLLTLLLLGITDGSAQVLDSSESGGGNTTVVNQQEASKPKPFLGTEVPFMNPGDETFSWDGKNWNIGNNRLFRARFEKYLNTPEADAEEDKTYRQTIKDILQHLSPHNKGGPNLQAAVALLPRASSHHIDANLCDSLSNAIYTVWLARKNVVALGKANDALDKERKLMEWNADVYAEPDKLKNQPPSRNNNNSAQAQQTAQQGVRVLGYLKRIAQIEALKIANDAKMGISEVQAKIEFQSLILQFAVQRRFEHVVMATRMYNKLFKDGDSHLEIKDGSDVEKILGQGLGTNPTISTLDAFANEAIRDIDEGVRAFEYLVEKDELESASKRLFESFIIGEYMPRIRTLERDKKRRVLAFVRDSFQLISALEVRDYGLADELVTRMRTEAKDFDYSKAKAAIAVYMNLSNAHLAQAKLAAQKGDMDRFEKEMRIAAESWPQNPNLKKATEVVTGQADLKFQAVNDLDSLISQKNYRQIFKDKGRYLAAVFDDPKRTEQLEEIFSAIAEVDIIIKQASKLAETGNSYGAWEGVEDTLRRFPNDPELNRVARELSTSVADFVATLKRAEALESSGKIGSSMSWFCRAKDIYPASTHAQKGIDRLLGEYLPRDRKGSASAVSPATSAAADPETPLSFE